MEPVALLRYGSSPPVHSGRNIGLAQSSGNCWLSVPPLKINDNLGVTGERGPWCRHCRFVAPNVPL